jgi:hypothetical protein
MELKDEYEGICFRAHPFRFSDLEYYYRTTITTFEVHLRFKILEGRNR